METILNKLKEKTEVGSKSRMPSINQISKLLAYYGIEHVVDESTNVVEHRSKGRRYVNSRYNGKTGLRLKIKNTNIELDTSSSYYSWNTWSYAKDILKLIEQKSLK